MKENLKLSSFKKPRKPIAPREPVFNKSKNEEPSFEDATLEENIKSMKEMLKKDPEIKQRAERVGSFHPIKEIQEKDKKIAEVKNGDNVKKGQIIGYLEALNIKDKIHAIADGIISNLLEEGAPVEYNQELFTITPTSETSKLSK